MKFKLDEWIPGEVHSHIIQLGYDVQTVHSENLTGHTDAFLWNTIQQEGRFFITMDLDFSDIRHYKPGTHYGILLIRLSKEGKTTVTEFIKWILHNYDPQEWKRSLGIATDHKLRIRKPES